MARARGMVATASPAPGAAGAVRSAPVRQHLRTRVAPPNRVQHPVFQAGRPAPLRPLPAGGDRVSAVDPAGPDDRRPPSLGGVQGLPPADRLPAGRLLPVAAHPTLAGGGSRDPAGNPGHGGLATVDA